MTALLMDGRGHPPPCLADQSYHITIDSKLASSDKIESCTRFLPSTWCYQCDHIYVGDLRYCLSKPWSLNERWEDKQYFRRTRGVSYLIKDYWGVYFKTTRSNRCRLYQKNRKLDAAKIILSCFVLFPLYLRWDPYHADGDHFFHSSCGVSWQISR